MYHIINQNIEKLYAEARKYAYCPINNDIAFKLGAYYDAIQMLKEIKLQDMADYEESRKKLMHMESEKEKAMCETVKMKDEHYHKM